VVAVMDAWPVAWSLAGVVMMALRRGGRDRWPSWRGHRRLPSSTSGAGGTRVALIVVDLPLGAYQASPEQVFGNAVRHLKEGGT
jgi:hypothetical protein